MITSIRTVLIAVAAIIAAAGSVIPAQAAELLYVSQANCPYCKAWDIEVGSVYSKTGEARIAPLRRVSIEALDDDAYRFREPVRYAPTFVLLERNAEVGRITGYSDASMFWGMLNLLLLKIQPDAPAAMQPIANRSGTP